LNQKFLFIQHESSDPYFNLAAEEYLLHNFEENVVFLYVNQPSVVVGKHQNAFDECQIEFCRENNIQIARRLSGGGTVFHGPGNLNFCFIKNGKETNKLIDFKAHLDPVISFLISIGIPAEYSGRNDILVDGFKVSGNAEHVFSKRKRVIHHGTLLFNADLKSLNQSIAPKSTIEFETHAVKSVRSKVKNIVDLNVLQFDFQEFKKQLGTYLIKHYKSAVYELKKPDLEQINALVETKFGTWEWNFGYSPKFKAVLTLNDERQVTLDVKKGVIDGCNTNDAGLSQQLQTCVGKRFLRETFSALGFDVVL
jgi:lipoate-protein ligase A